ncbi:2-oxoacid:acceptor oxidoreductase subunit alpha [Pelagibius sp. Alg239-R121]|uniref:2-oxoacid:acceptor oxidoreductase subunit alpha n=1 Tax=Pelagibius sp. Alg239-R121 TaxID=2993448 RepID=UPI0024A711F2|nr:2-oxoacid:acceptor oxidoreductase subunit alpha [Pelagibius sp. Alg239-R121]
MEIDEKVRESQAKSPVDVEAVVIRFAGDSGDGMQLAGTQVAVSSALMGNDIATFPDFPAEIRAPRGTPAGVSGFQVQFASRQIMTPGDTVDVLVAMNPAALKANLGNLKAQGTIVIDIDAFDAKGLRLAKYDENPVENGSLDEFQVIEAPITSQTRKAVEQLGIGHKIATRCRNFFAMGIIYWLYGRDLTATTRYIDSKFTGEVAEADKLALRAGWHYGETTEAFERSYQVPAASQAPGTYRNVTGNEALALGLMSAAHLSGKDLFYSAYPITPASDILHRVSRFTECGARTFQAEDEIAAICSAIGAAFGGAMGTTGSSGPGIALKTEALGLAVMLELPLLVINVQRGGPSTGLPTKVEQTDLLQAVTGRNGEAPMPVLAPSSPGDCFNIVIEAWRIATKLMTPVMILSDAFTANGAEPWRIPDITTLEAIEIEHPKSPTGMEPFRPYDRNEWLARPWALPGTPGLTHRIGGIEKADGTGAISYDPLNHEKMVKLRADKIEKTALLTPDLEIAGPESGELLVVSWGGTFGACQEAIVQAQRDGLSVAHVHLRCLNPLPRGLGAILKRYKTVLAPELNLGQLRQLVRAKYLVDVRGLNKVRGQPFWIGDITTEIHRLLGQEK